MLKGIQGKVGQSGTERQGWASGADGGQDSNATKRLHPCSLLPLSFTSHSPQRGFVYTAEDVATSSSILTSSTRETLDGQALWF